MSHSVLRRLAATAVKALISAGLLAFALRGFDFTSVLEHLGRVDGGAVAAAIVITTAIALLQARRWVVVLARMEHGVPLAQALKLVLVGYFFNQLLPSTIGGDAYRAWGAYKLGIHAGNAIISVVVDRLLALVALVVMIAAGAWWLFELITSPMARWAIAIIIAGTATGMILLLSLARFEHAMRRRRLTRFVAQVSQGLRAVMTSGGAAMEVLLLTIAGYAAISYVVYLLASGLGVNLSLGQALLFVPLVTLVAILPISIAGWGLRESAMVVALGMIGVPAVKAFSLSVMFGLVVMASGLPGGILWLLGRRHRPDAEPMGAP